MAFQRMFDEGVERIDDQSQAFVFARGRVLFPTFECNLYPSNMMQFDVVLVMNTCTVQSHSANAGGFIGRLEILANERRQMLLEMRQVPMEYLVLGCAGKVDVRQRSPSRRDWLLVGSLIEAYMPTCVG